MKILTSFFGEESRKTKGRRRNRRKKKRAKGNAALSGRRRNVISRSKTVSLPGGGSGGEK